MNHQSTPHLTKSSHSLLFKIGLLFCALAVSGCGHFGKRSGGVAGGPDDRPVVAAPPPPIAQPDDFRRVFGHDCQSTSVDDGVASDCFQMYYVTTRKFEPLAKNYGSGMSNTVGTGRVSMTAALVLPNLLRGKKYCDEIKRNPAAPSIVDRVTCSEITDPTEIEKLLTPAEQLRFDIVGAGKAIDPQAQAREEDELVKAKSDLAKSDLKGLERIETAGKGDPYDILLKDLSRAMDAQRVNDSDPRSVMIYIHGFNTTFKKSLEGGAHLAADLNMWANQSEKEPRRFPLGVPIVFSWPALDAEHEFPNPTYDTDNPLAILFKYYISQLRADTNSPDFKKFIKQLAKGTAVKQINIVAHSMGNRVLLNNMDLFQEGLKNNEGSSVTVRIVNAAGDIGWKEFKKSFPNSANSANRLRSTAYFSDTDLALRGKDWREINESRLDSSEFANLKKKDIVTEARKNVKNPRRELIPPDPNYKVFRASAIAQIDNLLGQRQQQLGLTEKNWFKEDWKCRLGGRKREGCARENIPNALEMVDATGFDADYSKFDNPDNRRHGYFEAAPMVLSDISCALRGFGAESGERSLAGRPKTRDKEPPSKEKRKYWSLESETDSDFDVNAIDPYCAATDRLYLVLKRVRITRDVYFDVTGTYPCSEQVENDVPGAEPLPVPPCGPGQSASDEIEQALQEAADEPYAARFEITVLGYADRSDATPGRNYDNCGLSEDRASVVAGIVRETLDRLGMTDRASVFHEGRCMLPEGPIETGPDMREKLNRKVTIVIEVVRDQVDQVTAS